MRWFVAHVVLRVDYKELIPSSQVSCWENLYLIQANTSAEAHSKAVVLAQQATGDDSGTFRWEGKPARWVFAGIRKVVECCSEASDLGDGTELTFYQLVFPTQNDLQAYLDGNSVSVLIDR